MTRQDEGPEAPYAHSPGDGCGWEAAHDLREHLESVSTLAREAASPLGNLKDLAGIAGLWHDLGKYQPAFQAYIRGHGPRVSHKLAGAQLARDRLGQHLGMLVTLAIAGHHGGIPAWQGVSTTGFRERLGEAAAELAAAIGAGVPQEIAGRQLGPEVLGAANQILTSVAKEDSALAAELLLRFVFSCLVDADYRDTAAFYNPETEATRQRARAEQSSLVELTGRLDAHLDTLQTQVPPTLVNHWRRIVLERCRQAANEQPGVFELTVPTGGGKTLAAMSFALRHAVRHGLRRVIVVIPYTSIIEQNAATYASILGSQNVLEHHSAWDPEDAFKHLAPREKPEARHRHKLLAENWDAPVVVTTSVQFLESLHGHRPGACRKLHNILGSVVILDEVQTLPTHLLEPTMDTLRSLAGAFKVSVVTCTATQPALVSRVDSAGRTLRGLGQPRRIVQDPGPLFAALRRVKVAWPADLRTSTSWEALAQEIARERRVLVIVHRRADARELASMMGDGVFHLSATMLPAHRSRTLHAIRTALPNQGSACRVVSTQIVEAGVDLDFPVVYRAFAGLDSLAQAAGRCNREGLLEGSGELRIFVAPTSPPPGVLRRAQDVARGFVAESAPEPLSFDEAELFRRYYARLYDTGSIDAPGITALRRGPLSDFPEIADRYRLVEDGWQLPVVVPWQALDSRTLRAIAQLRQGYADAESWRLIHRASVSIRRDTVLDWARRGVVSVAPEHPQAILDLESWPRLYSEQFGLDATADPQLTSEELNL